MIGSQQVARLLAELSGITKPYAGHDCNEETRRSIQEGIAELLNKFDPELDWSKIVKVEEHLDRAPGALRIHFEFEQDEDIPKWFRDHISGFQKDTL